MTIYIDMDGTIVDFYNRFYICYCETMKRVGCDTNLTLKEFIILRRTGKHLFDRQKENYLEVARIFDSLVEEMEYLNMDTIIPGMDNVIKKLSETHNICVVSFRANRTNLLRQISNIGLGEYTSAICMSFNIDGNVGAKADLILQYDKDPKGYIIGDDIYEVAAGKKLGLTTISVTWGSRGSDILKTFEPDHIVYSPECILEIIK